MNKQEMEQLVDIREIHMEENMTRQERINYLKEISKDGYVKYDNVLIYLDFQSPYPEEKM